MTYVKRCDFCGDVIEGKHRRQQASLMLLTDDNPDGADFCSWRCIADYAQKRAGIQTRVPTITVTCDGEPCPPRGHRRLWPKYPNDTVTDKYRGVI